MPLPLLLLLLLLGVHGRDPNYAVTVSVNEDKQGLQHEFRLVSLSWFDYFNANTPDHHIYFKLLSLPLMMRVRSVSRPGRILYQTTTNDLFKERLLVRAFERVARTYFFALLSGDQQQRPPLIVHRNSVDKQGVALSSGTFNRTILVDFRDPPYSQSRPNLLVTNRQVPWTVWVDGNTERVRFREDYNQTEDLMYRFYHNLGHSLGFGHYLGSRRAGGGSSTFERSIMYANYQDHRFSSTRPLIDGVDARAMPVMAQRARQLIRNRAERLVNDELAPALVTLLQHSAL